MIRDPHYRRLEEALAKPVDPVAFERCAAALLGEFYPGLAPVPGGSDSGMDGAVPDGAGAPYPLIATTSDRVLANFNRSIDSYVRDGGVRRSAVVATTRSLTPQKRRNLEKAAGEKGFTIVGIHDRSSFCDLLYHNSHWSLELLALTGAPRTLSSMPLRTRPHLLLPLVGRETDLEWLHLSADDLLLVGQPGSGKTFLLEEFARQSDALFFISEDLAEVANDVRDLRPKIIIVDDAHVRIDHLSRLRHLRDEMGADFRILASSWPGGELLVRRALGIESQSVRNIGRLGPSHMALLIRNARIRGPKAIVHEILNQSAGQPGLAALLCMVAFRASQRLFTGEALMQAVVDSFSQLIGERASTILACFALAGDTGMRQSVVAEFLRLDLASVRHATSSLAAGGVLVDLNTTLKVVPPALRHALVADAFFGGAASLEIADLLRKLDDPSIAARTLVGARSRRRTVPDGLIRTLLVTSRDAQAWREYSMLGEDEATWVVTESPDKLLDVAPYALNSAPNVLVDMLLAPALDREAGIGNRLSRPLEILEEWVSDPRQGPVATKKRLLIEAAIRMRERGCDEAVAVQVIAIALSPELRFVENDPTSENAISMATGVFSLADLEELREMWQEVVAHFRSYPPRHWEPLLQTIDAWRRADASRNPLPAASNELLTKHAHQMVVDVSELGRQHVGVMLRLAQLADLLKVELPHFDSSDEEFAVLYPRERRATDWEAFEEEQRRRADALISKWIEDDADSVVDRICGYELAAREARLTWPRQTPYVCSEISRRVANPLEWFRSFRRYSPDDNLVLPFLLRALGRDAGDTIIEMKACLRENAFVVAVMQVALSRETAISLLDGVSANLGTIPTVVHAMAIRGELTPEALSHLLEHPNQPVRAAAASGEWRWIKKGLRESSTPWRSVVIHDLDEYPTEEILEIHHDIAYEWIRVRLTDVYSGHVDVDSWSPSRADFSYLSIEVRCQLLRSVTDRCRAIGLVQRLAKNAVCYLSLLQNNSARCLHMIPLMNDFGSDDWLDRAIAALDFGYEPSDVVEATIELPGVHWGTSHLEERRDQLSSLTYHTDARIVAIGHRLSSEIDGRLAAHREREQRWKDRYYD